MMGVTSLPGSSWKEKLSIRPEEGCSEMVLMYVRPSARVREVLSRVVPAGGEGGRDEQRRGQHQGGGALGQIVQVGILHVDAPYSSGDGYVQAGPRRGRRKKRKWNRPHYSRNDL